MKFTKMQGAGNDYVYVNAFTEKLPSDLGELARKLADRHYGVGGDGMILICPSERADARMWMFNVDGSEGEIVSTEAPSEATDSATDWGWLGLAGLLGRKSGRGFHEYARP